MQEKERRLAHLEGLLGRELMPLTSGRIASGAAPESSTLCINRAYSREYHTLCPQIAIEQLSYRQHFRTCAEVAKSGSEVFLMNTHRATAAGPAWAPQQEHFIVANGQDHILGVKELKYPTVLSRQEILDAPETKCLNVVSANFQGPLKPRKGK